MPAIGKMHDHCLRMGETILWRRFLFLMFMAFVVILVAAKPHGSFSGGLTGPTIDPTVCYHEDSHVQYFWYGNLGPGEVFTVPLFFCDATTFEGQGFPGSSGFMAAFWDGRGLYLDAVSPSGIVYPGHLLQTKPTETWKKCMGFVTTSGGPGQGYAGYTIEPGVWTVHFSNVSSHTARKVWAEIDVGMSWGLTGICPAEDVTW